MNITAKQYAKSLLESVENKKQAEIEKIINKFIQNLIKNNNISQLNKILDFFSILWNKKHNIIKTEIKTVNKLDENNIEELKNNILKLSQAEKIELKQKQQKQILGGIIIKHGDKIIDQSLKTKLNLLSVN